MPVIRVISAQNVVYLVRQVFASPENLGEQRIVSVQVLSGHPAVAGIPFFDKTVKVVDHI
jgi:hypothetical protein